MAFKAKHLALNTCYCDFHVFGFLPALNAIPQTCANPTLGYRVPQNRYIAED